MFSPHYYCLLPFSSLCYFLFNLSSFYYHPPTPLPPLSSVFSVKWEQWPHYGMGGGCRGGAVEHREEEEEDVESRGDAGEEEGGLLHCVNGMINESVSPVPWDQQWVTTGHANTPVWCTLQTLHTPCSQYCWHYLYLGPREQGPQKQTQQVEKLCRKQLHLYVIVISPAVIALRCRPSWIKTTADDTMHIFMTFT